MKYKCIKPYSEYDVNVMDIGDIVLIDGTNLYNLTKKVDYNQLLSINDAIKNLEVITDEPKYVDTRHPFQVITDDMFATYLKKNHDYGDSFTNALEEEGLAAMRIQGSFKWDRFKTLSKHPNSSKVKEESIRDTILDMANYLIMTAMWMDAHGDN